LLKEEYFHVLNWMHFPYVLSLIIGILALFLLTFLYYIGFMYFLSIAPTLKLIDGIKEKRKLYAINYILVSLIGFTILHLINYPRIRLYEIIEVSSMVLPLSINLIRKLDKQKAILKNDTTSKINIFAILLLVFLLGWYLYIK
jgi:hypothetical protein